jgi:RNA polymerase sigma factor (sigma-70 family)
VEPRTDSELVVRARAGDKEAFDQLVTRYLPLARRAARHFVADDETARDLVQEALLQAYLSLGSLKDGSRFAGWLSGIVRNVCRGYLRDRGEPWLSLETLAGGLQVDAIGSDRAPDPLHAIEAREQYRRLQDALDALPARDAQVARLFYIAQRSLQEISAGTGLSVPAVKNRLYRARRQLRERLLPLYPQMAEKEKRVMIPVTVSGVYEAHPEGRGTTVVLTDESGRRALRIAMGPAEAGAIDMALRRQALPRPMTFRFMADLMDAAGAKLEEVRLESLREGVFYAVAKLRRGKTVRELDARPSDALALAVQTGSPIFVAEAIMGQAGLDLPADFPPGQSAPGEERPIPELLPILPLRDKVYFPHGTFPIFLGRSKSLRALEEARATDGYVLLLTQKEAHLDDPGTDDIYPVGTVCQVLQVLNLPDDTARVMLEGKARMRVVEHLQSEPYFCARGEVLPEPEDSREGMEALMQVAELRYHNLAVEKKTSAYASVIPPNEDWGPGRLADAIAPYLPLPVEEQQALLKITNPRQRLEKLASHLADLDAAHTRP